MGDGGISGVTMVPNVRQSGSHTTRPSLERQMSCDNMDLRIALVPNNGNMSQNDSFIRGGSFVLIILDVAILITHFPRTYAYYLLFVKESVNTLEIPYAFLKEFSVCPFCMEM